MDYNYITATEVAAIKAEIAQSDPTPARFREIIERLLVATNTRGHDRYDPKFGDDELCACGHPYYRHFDSYANMDPVGCKYCGCDHFVEPTDEHRGTFNYGCDSDDT